MTNNMPSTEIDHRIPQRQLLVCSGDHASSLHISNALACGRRPHSPACKVQRRLPYELAARVNVSASIYQDPHDLV